MNAIIVHGCPEKENYYRIDLPCESNAHWLPWLQRELMIRDIATATPEIPFSYEPQWERWVKELERYDISDETILVGHSAGAGFLVKYLSTHPDLRVKRLVLVAPWLDPDQTIKEKSFFEFSPDSLLAARTKRIDVLYAEDDSESVQQSLTFLRENFKDLEYHKFPSGYGHFTYENLKTDAFEELRDLILKDI